MISNLESFSPKAFWIISIGLVISIGTLVDPILIVVAYLLVGVPEASRQAPRMRILGGATQESRLGKDSVLPLVGFALGNFLSQFWAGQLADLIGFRPLFFLQGFLLLTETIIFVRFIQGYQLRASNPDKKG